MNPSAFHFPSQGDQYLSTHHHLPLYSPSSVTSSPTSAVPSPLDPFMNRYGKPLNPITIMPLILTRHYHRWLPRLAKEPTSTLLLITPDNTFLDLRFSRADSAAPAAPILLLHATGGAYSREPTLGLRDTTISSAADHTEPHFHTLHQQANGDIMEAGEMRDPSRGGEFAPYEAVWRVLPAAPRVSVVMVLREGRGMVVRVGGWCQGMVKGAGGEVTAERWKRAESAKWERVHRVGKEVLPCAVACMDRDEDNEADEWQGGRYWREAVEMGVAFEKVVAVGDLVKFGCREWEVVERSQW